MTVEKTEELNLDGSMLAKYFKYFKNMTNSASMYHIRPLLILAKSLYKLNQKTFDACAEIFKKHKLDVIDYMKFVVSVEKIQETEITLLLLNLRMLSKYVEYLLILKLRNHIYKLFSKTVDFLSTECIAFGYKHSRDFFLELIKTKRLANYYVSGNISKYFLAALPKFPLIVLKMDKLSRDEFEPLVNSYDKYHLDIGEALLQAGKNRVSIFLLIDDKIVTAKV